MTQTQNHPLRFAVSTDQASDLFTRLVGEEHARKLLTDRGTYDQMAQETSDYHTQPGFKPAKSLHVMTDPESPDVVVTYGYTLGRDLDDTAFTVAVLPETDQVVVDLSHQQAFTPGRKLPSSLRPGHGDYEILRQWASDHQLGIPLETLNAGMLVRGKPFTITDLNIEQANSLGEALDIHNLPINPEEASKLAVALEDDEKVYAGMKDGVYRYYSTSGTIFLLDFNKGTASMAIPEERAQSGRHAYEMARDWCENTRSVYAEFQPPLEDRVPQEDRVNPTDPEIIRQDLLDALEEQLVQAHRAQVLCGRS